MTGVNAAEMPVRAIPMQKLRSFLSQEKGVQGQIHLNMAMNDKNQIQHFTNEDFHHFVSNAELSRTVSRQGILRVAAYIRVSTDAGDQENSYELQDEYFAQLLRKNPDWSSAGVYADYGISGTNRDSRTGFRRLLRHCQEGRIDRILCKSISRFARNTGDFMTALDILHKNQVTILFEKENLDTRDSASSFILTTLGAIAQEESRTISTNVLWSYRKRFPKGHTQNVALYGYRFLEGEDCEQTLEGGYRIRRLEIIEEEAQVIRTIFTQVSQGKPYAQIARDLNARKIPAPNEGRRTNKAEKRTATGEPVQWGWTGAVISGLISRERYCGDVLLQKTYTPDYLSHKSVKNEGQLPQYLVRNHHPAIIDRELFERVQAVRLQNADRCRNREKERIRYPFSGCLICAHCGRYYHTRNANTQRIWFCPTSALNNGRMLCQAEKICEEQLAYMVRKAFLSRFARNLEPMPEEVTVADIRTGQYQVGPCSFSGRAKDFVSQIWMRLDNVHRTDSMERDRSFLKRRITTLQTTIREAEERISSWSFQKGVLEDGANLPGNAGQIAHLSEKIETETAKQQEARKEQETLERCLFDLESYWERLEADYGDRAKALEWMKTLPEGQEGTSALLNGLSGAYVRAFALDITVWNPLHYTVHWFDDTRTSVEMDNNG